MRLVVAEDEALLRRGLVLMLEQAGHTVVGEAADAEELVRLVDAELPDLLVTDIRMPPRGSDDGLLAALEVRARHPALGVLVLSQHVQRSYAQELLRHCPDAVGYLLKQRISDVTQFLADLQAVGDGAIVLDPDVVDVAMARARAEAAGVDRLTERQREVLGLMAQGRSNAAIARSLFVSEKAVVVHASNIYAALDLPPSGDDHRRVLAVLQLLG